MEAHEELGPIDIVVIAFPADAPMTGEAVPLVMDLVERGIIRVLDVLFVMENDDGTFSGFEAKDLEAGKIGDFKVFEGASSGLLGEDEVTAGAVRTVGVNPRGGDVARGVPVGDFLARLDAEVAPFRVTGA